MEIKEQLINHLLHYRAEIGKTQDEMALYLDIGYRTYQDIESTGIVKKTTDFLNIIEKTGFDITKKIADSGVRRDYLETRRNLKNHH